MTPSPFPQGSSRHPNLNRLEPELPTVRQKRQAEPGELGG